MSNHCIIDLLDDDDDDGGGDVNDGCENARGNPREGDDTMEDSRNERNMNSYNKTSRETGSPTVDEYSQDSPLYGFSNRNFRTLIQPCEIGHEDEYASLSLVYLTLTHIFNASSAGVLIVPPLYTHNEAKIRYFNDNSYCCHELLPQHLPLDNPEIQSQFTTCIIPVYSDVSRHISLLVYDREGFFHYDSLNGLHDTALISKILSACYTDGYLGSYPGLEHLSGKSLFCKDKARKRLHLSITTVKNTPQQPNFTDCGFYAICIGQMIIQRAATGKYGALCVDTYLRNYHLSLYTRFKNAGVGDTFRSPYSEQDTGEYFKEFVDRTRKVIYDTFSRVENIHTIVAEYSKKYSNGSYPRQLSENFPIYGISTRDLMLMFSNKRLVSRVQIYLLQRRFLSKYSQRKSIEMTMDDQDLYKTILEYKVDDITRDTIFPINCYSDNVTQAYPCSDIRESHIGKIDNGDNNNNKKSGSGRDFKFMIIKNLEDYPNLNQRSKDFGKQDTEILQNPLIVFYERESNINNIPIITIRVPLPIDMESQIEPGINVFGYNLCIIISDDLPSRNVIEFITNRLGTYVKKNTLDETVLQYDPLPLVLSLQYEHLSKYNRQLVMFVLLRYVMDRIYSCTNISRQSLEEDCNSLLRIIVTLFPDDINTNPTTTDVPSINCTNTDKSNYLSSIWKSLMPARKRVALVKSMLKSISASLLLRIMIDSSIGDSFCLPCTIGPTLKNRNHSRNSKSTSKDNSNDNKTKKKPNWLIHVGFSNDVDIDTELGVIERGIIIDDMNHLHNRNMMISINTLTLYCMDRMDVCPGSIYFRLLPSITNVPRLISNSKLYMMLNVHILNLFEASCPLLGSPVFELLLGSDITIPLCLNKSSVVVNNTFTTINTTTATAPVNDNGDSEEFRESAFKVYPFALLEDEIITINDFPFL